MLNIKNNAKQKTDTSADKQTTVMDDCHWNTRPEQENMMKAREKIASAGKIKFNTNPNEKKIQFRMNLYV